MDDLVSKKQARNDFRLLWIGQGLAAIGTQITALALPLTAILVLHAQADAVGILNALQWLPFLLLSLIIGVAVDRYRRRPLMMLADAARATILGGIVALAETHRLSLFLLGPLVFLFGCGAVVFDLAYYAYVPNLVGVPALLGANSRLQATTTATQLGGPAVAGILVQVLTAPLTLMLNAFSFLVSVTTVAAIRTPEPEPNAPATRPLADLCDGLRLVFSNRLLRSLVAVSASYNVFNQWIFTLYLVYSVHFLHLSPALIGLSLSGATVGAFLGAMVARTASNRCGVGFSFVGAVITECLAALLIPITPAGTPLTIPLLVVAFGLMDFGASLSSVVALSVRQTITPNRLLGRMTAGYRTVSYGTIPLGAAIGGWVGQLLGLRVGLAIGVAALVTTILWAIVSPLVHVRNIEDVPPIEDVQPADVSI